MSEVAELIELVAARAETIPTAESLTAGMLASRIADVSGASRVLLGGVVSYATALKQAVLEVPEQVVVEHGVVSEACAVAMAEGARRLLGSTWVLSTTGVAGPERQDGKPVGTVWIAAAGPERTVTRRLELAGSRAEIRSATCAEAVAFLTGILQREETTLG